MNIRKFKRPIAVGLAALFLTGVPFSYAAAEDGTEAASEAVTEQSTEAPTEASLSSVTVVHTAEITDTDYEPTDWWKAGLDEYDDLSLVSYESMKRSATEESEFLAEGRDDSIVSNSPTPSAVGSTENGTFAFTSYGWGHCVGLSQNGANFYAKYAGWNYRDILFHYYPGTSLINTGTAESEIVTVQGVPGNVLQQVAEIVNMEIGPSFEVECIKAQAVAVYTYMKYHDNDAHDLKGKPDPPQSLIDACASVLGEALVYHNEFCLTMFYASCGGITANCYDVFSADLPYLRSVASEYDQQYDPHWGDVTYYTIDEVRSRIQGAYGITLSSDPNNWIQIVEGNGGYVNRVVIDGQLTVRGNAFRSVMGLKSPKFTYICNAAQPVGSADPDGAAELPAETPEQTDTTPSQPAETPSQPYIPPEAPVQPSTPESVPTDTPLAPPPMPSQGSGASDLTAPPLDSILT